MARCGLSRSCVTHTHVMHMILSLWLLAVFHIQLSSAALCHKNFPISTYPHCVQLSSSYVMHWSVRNATVYFGVEVDQVGGWFGLGLSEAGAMKGSDVWLVTQGTANSWKVQDSYATGNVMPAPDDIQDVQLVNDVVVTQNSTRFELRRQLKTCDDANDLAMTVDELITIVWAYGEGVAQHLKTNRGSLKVRLRGTPGGTAVSADTGAAAMAGTLSLEMRMPSSKLPAGSLFMCRTFEVPAETKHHAVRVMYTTTTPLVQAMTLYACSSLPSAKIIGQVYKCPVMPLSTCRNIFSAWHQGADVDNMPPKAGLPLGPGGFQYFTLQVRYSVPESAAGTLDTSGATLTYTPTLRQFDLGILQLSQTWLQIPGDSPTFTSPVSICPKECTARLPMALTMESQSMHMHEMGMSMITRHYRNGKELQPVGERKAWNPSFPSMDSVPVATSELLPGDTLATTCTFSTVGSSKDIVYGSGINQEMCANYIRYYPATDLQLCMNLNPTEWTINATAAIALCANRDTLEKMTNQKKWASLKEYTRALLTDGLLLPFVKNQVDEENVKAYDALAGCAESLPPLPVSPPPQSPPPQMSPPAPGQVFVGVNRVPVVTPFRDNTTSASSDAASRSLSRFVAGLLSLVCVGLLSLLS